MPDRLACLLLAADAAAAVSAPPARVIFPPVRTLEILHLLSPEPAPAAAVARLAVAAGRLFPGLPPRKRCRSRPLPGGLPRVEPEQVCLPIRHGKSSARRHIFLAKA